MPYQTFEDLRVYQLACQFRKKIYGLTKDLPDHEKFNLVGQMRRASTSLTNNIAEGHGRYHYQENIQFCRMSRGSLSEIIDDINICHDEGYLTSEGVSSMKTETYELLKCLNGYIAHLKRRKEEDT
jgi:four helix bundle protein